MRLAKKARDLLDTAEICVHDVLHGESLTKEQEDMLYQVMMLLQEVNK
jgi:hypothetical protein